MAAGFENAESGLIRTLEECALNSWPALETVHYDGWVLRFAAGYTRRANSVQPLYPCYLDPLEKIRYCHQLYRDRGLPTRFRIASVSQELDDLLSNRGYDLDDLTSVVLLDLSQAPEPGPDETELLSRPSRAWIAAYCAMNPSVRQHFLTMTQMLEQITLPACFLALRRGGETVALGMAVAERSYLALAQLSTRRGLQHQGIEEQVIWHLAQWGKRQGADWAHFQVNPGSEGEMFFRKLGFSEVYRYWYRVRAAPG